RTTVSSCLSVTAKYRLSQLVPITRPVCPQLLVLSRMLRPPRTPLFPYTTLFRSLRSPRAPRHKTRGEHKTFRRGRRGRARPLFRDRKSTRLNSSHQIISYAVFCLKKKKGDNHHPTTTHNIFCTTGIISLPHTRMS